MGLLRRPAHRRETLRHDSQPVEHGCAVPLKIVQDSGAPGQSAVSCLAALGGDRGAAVVRTGFDLVAQRDRVEIAGGQRHFKRILGLPVAGAGGEQVHTVTGEGTGHP